MNELRCDSRFISTWNTRFASEPLVGDCRRFIPVDRRGVIWRGRRRARARYTLNRKPHNGTTYWSSRRLAPNWACGS